MQRHPRPLPLLLSVSAIARKIQRSHKGVQDTIIRLGIQPDVPNPRLYREERSDEIAAAMRASNGQRATPQESRLP